MKKRHIRLTSFNVQGVHSNKHFVTEIAEKCDILCIQEHWLKEYDLVDLTKIFNGKLIQSKAQYDTHVDHSRKTIGHGGIATIIGEKLAPFVDSGTTDGNDRILVTTINIESGPLCILNCYLPSGNTAEALEKFKEDMDAIHILIQKYSNTHEILLTGDLNLDHYNRNGPKEKIFKSAIKEDTLTDLGVETKFEFSYINPHLNHRSRIDHALVKRKMPSYSWSVAEVVNEDNDLCSTNSSYHQPLKFTLKLPTEPSTARKDKREPSTRKIYNRKDMDRMLFTSCLDEEIQAYKWEMLDPEIAIQTLLNVMDTAIIESTPHKARSKSKKKGQDWYPELREAVKESKLKHQEWKAAGKPRENHQTWIEKKAAKKIVRKVQRQKKATERQTLLEEISQATENDPQLAFKLIKKQTKQDTASTALRIDGRTITDNTEILDGWANYFENLTKKTRSVVECYEESEANLMRLQTYAQQDNSEFNMAMDDLETAIRKLKPNKAADLRGHHAELLKLMSQEARIILLKIINQILRNGKIPQVLKESYKIVLPKPGKDHTSMDNYRGITMASVILKVIEMMWLHNKNEDSINGKISQLQFGFTVNRSPTMASLLLTEAMLEAKTTRKTLHIISLDAKKAFDVVDHAILKKKLYHMDLQPRMWRLIDDLYLNSSEVVRWKGEDSRKYFIQRGVKQGSIISPLLYKLYINQLLLDL